MSGHDNLRVKDGYYLRIENLGQPGAKDFVFVDKHEPAFYRFTMDADATVNSDSGARAVEDLKPLALNELFQCFWGVEGRGYVYLNLPPNARLWGPGRNPIASASLREIGWVTEDRSPPWAPSPSTEFWLMKGGNFEFPAFIAYNPTPRTIRPKIYIEINKLRVSPVRDGAIKAALMTGRIPFRPITFGGIPAERSGPG